MKIVNLTLICFIIVLLFISCGRDDEPIMYPTPCITKEPLSDTISGFEIFEKGLQEYGFAKGIKINQPYESSVFINDFSDSTIIFHLQSAIFNERGWMLETENIFIANSINNINLGCFPLTKNNFSIDSFNVRYSIDDYDINILFYRLDMSADNAIEIISYEPESQKLKAKLKASFIADKEYLPYLPKNVRFSDIYIEHGY